MRKVSNENDIPYLFESIRYYEAYNNELRELNQDRTLLSEAYARAKSGASKIYFTWHGQYRTDMFEVDDLPSFGLAYGFEQSDHTHDIEWHVRDINERGAYVTVDVEFKCGCTFDGLDGDKKLQMTLKSLKGWEMSKSYISGCRGKHTVRILKSSLRND